MKCSCGAGSNRTGREEKKCGSFLDVCVSSVRRGHANLLCIAPISSDVSEETMVQSRTKNLRSCATPSLMGFMCSRSQASLALSQATLFSPSHSPLHSPQTCTPRSLHFAAVLHARSFTAHVSSPTTTHGRCCHIVCTSTSVHASPAQPSLYRSSSVACQCIWLNQHAASSAHPLGGPGELGCDDGIPNLRQQHKSGP